MQVMVRSSPRRPGSRTMSWLRWLLAYLFDCVHPHTTWPHRDRVGLAYVCCLDCGREIPYSGTPRVREFLDRLRSCRRVNPLEFPLPMSPDLDIGQPA